MEENVAKALLIAAGILITVMLLSIIVLGYNQISNFYNTQSEKKRNEQLAEFNEQFLNYQRNDLRGTDVITLVNKVIDYNERYVYAEGTGYDRVIITIDMTQYGVQRDYILNQFKYSDSDESLIQEVISNRNTIGENRDNILNDLIRTELTLIEEAKTVGLNNISSTKLQKLAANISYIALSGTEEDNESKLKKRTDFLKKTLGQEFNNSISQLTKIKEITSKYYQYMQFKRAHFSCDELIFDQQTGRVCEIKIVVKTQNNNVVFN